MISAAVALAGPAVAAPPSGPDFDQVLAAPDDPQVNLDYARARADAGDLLEAAAALERVLAVHPDWDSARLFYAVVLYRLDDQQDAARQLDQVRPAGLTPLQQAEAEKYRHLIHREGGGAKLGGSVSVGMTHDSDAVGLLLVQIDTGAPAKGAATKGPGSSRVITASLDGSIPLGTSEKLKAYGSLDAVDVSRMSGPDNDFRRIGGEAGLMIANRLSNWRVGVVARDISLFGAHYLTEWGGAAQASRRLSGSNTLTVAFEAAHQAYDEPDVDLLTGDGGHDGWHYDLSAAIEHRFSGRSSLGVSVGVESKTARYSPFDYTAERIQAGYNRWLGRGAYASLSGSLRQVDYSHADPIFLFGEKRKDTISDVRLTLGAPLSAFTRAGATGDFREKLTLEGTISQTRRDSKAPLLDFNDTGASLRLVWRFGANQ